MFDLGSKFAVRYKGLRTAVALSTASCLSVVGGGNRYAGKPDVSLALPILSGRLLQALFEAGQKSDGEMEDLPSTSDAVGAYDEDDSSQVTNRRQL